MLKALAVRNVSHYVHLRNSSRNKAWHTSCICTSPNTHTRSTTVLEAHVGLAPQRRDTSEYPEAYSRCPTTYIMADIHHQEA